MAVVDASDAAFCLVGFVMPMDKLILQEAARGNF
jgi:hypothetical protein